MDEAMDKDTGAETIAPPHTRRVAVDVDGEEQQDHYSPILL